MIRIPQHLWPGPWMPLALLPLALASAAVAAPQACSTATLKGTYLYNHGGVLNGKPYAESGREVYDGKGGIVLTYQGSDGASGVEQGRYSVSADCVIRAAYGDGQKATGFSSPDGSRFTYTITQAPGAGGTALAGSELRVAP